jgi:hypothetical protein
MQPITLEAALAEIHFHDAVLRRVVEEPEAGELLLEVDYPVDWQADRFEPRVIVFGDVLDYSVREGNLDGAPTLLAADVVGERDGRSLVRIETNAGHRELLCRSVTLRVSEPGSSFTD